MDRRTFVQQTGFAGAALVAGLTTPAGAAEVAARMPRIKLGKLEVSRFVLGSNPFGGYAHQPGDLGQRMRDWYTDERILGLLDEAARWGITTCDGLVTDRWLRLWKQYRDRGGPLRHWIAQITAGPDTIRSDMDRAVAAGAEGLYVQGHRVEQQYEAGTFDVVRGWVEHAQALGVPAGLAAHMPECHLEAEKRGFPTDFYFQCFYNVAHGDKFSDADRQKAVETIPKLTKPVIGYKVLGAGRNEPRAAFAFALQHLRPTDGVCVGIYPAERPTELADDVGLFVAG